MAQASASKRFDTSADELWGRIGGWATIHEWHPAVASTDVSEDGKIRTLSLEGGGTLVESLQDEGERSYTYRFEEAPLPVQDYQATIRVRPDGDGSVVEWQGTFEPAGVEEAEAVELMQGIYRAGLDAL